MDMFFDIVNMWVASLRNIMEDIMKHSMKQSVSGGDLPKDVKYEFVVTIDYTGIPQDELIKKAYRSDLITLQQSFRKENPETLKGYAKDGYEVKWNDVGKKSGVSYLTLLMGMGMPEERAKAVLNDPALFNKLIEGIKAAVGE